jgi:hypothetical protein
MVLLACRSVVGIAFSKWAGCSDPTGALWRVAALSKDALCFTLKSKAVATPASRPSRFPRWPGR